MRQAAWEFIWYRSRSTSAVDWGEDRLSIQSNGRFGALGDHMIFDSVELVAERATTLVVGELVNMDEVGRLLK